jgi:ribosomal protein S18 acetylase RimI-like enzyme
MSEGDETERKIDPQIRPASSADLPLLMAADHMGTEPKRKEQVQRAIDQGHCWLAESDGRVLGYVITDTSFYGHPFVWLLVVASAFRRRGVATALMRHVEAMFSGGKLFTSTNESNLPSQRLMESLGFQRSGRVENLDEADPEILYFKSLDSN